MSTVRSFSYRIALLALCTLGTVSCDQSGENRYVPAALGSDPVHHVTQCSESFEVFSRLASRGHRNLVLVHVSSRGNLKLMPQAQLTKLRALLKKNQGGSFAERTGNETGVLSNDNYLIAAAQTGFVKEIYWILPGKLLEYSNAEQRIKEQLAKDGYGFSREEIADLQFYQGCVSGNLADVKVNICDVETMPRIAEPVVLDLDAGFFPMYAQTRNLNVLEGMKDCFDHFKEKLAVTEAYIRSTLREGTLSPLFLHISGNIQAILENPSILKAPPPELWTARDMAATMLNEHAIPEAVTFIHNAKKKYPQDKPLDMLSGIAESLSGHPEKGLRTLSALCADDRTACYSLPYVALALHDQGKAEEAPRFLARFGQAFPDAAGKLGGQQP